MTESLALISVFLLPLGLALGIPLIWYMYKLVIAPLFKKYVLGRQGDDDITAVDEESLGKTNQDENMVYGGCDNESERQKRIDSDSSKGKTLISFIGLLVAILLFFSSGLRLPFIDSEADNYFKDGISKAGSAYAVCRAVNASVSVIKESNLEVEPAGIGVSLAIGQALDPIDDMTERLSDLLVTAITSLGVQKLTYEISVSLAPPVIAVLFTTLLVLTFFEGERTTELASFIKRLLLMVVIARLCLPISSVGNNYIQQKFFDDQITTLNRSLEGGTGSLENLRDFSLPEIDGILGTIENSASFLKKRTIDFKRAVLNTISNAGNIIDYLLKLTCLYVGVFLLQVMILPVCTFWAISKVINSLFNTNLPGLINRNRGKSPHM